MRPATIEKCKEFYRLKEEGMKAPDIFKKLHLGDATIVKYNKMIKAEPKALMVLPQSKKTTRKYIKTPSRAVFVDLIPPPTQNHVAIVICSLENVKQVLAGLS